MKNDLLVFSSKKLLFSAFMASAILAGGVLPADAETFHAQTAMQKITVKGQVFDPSGQTVIEPMWLRREPRMP